MTVDRGHPPELPDAPREPFTALRSWEPDGDDGARAKARAHLQAHIAASRPTALSRLRPRARTQRRWLAPATALVLIAGAGGAVASVLLRTQHTSRLAVFTSQGRLSPEFTVGATGRGFCWEASLAAATARAYRCFQGNEIHDPCFAASSHARTVACFLDPWQPVTILRLTRPLPRLAPPASGAAAQLPWAIVTTSGRHCTYMTGATALVGGERLNYGCTNRTYLIGSPDTRAPLWTIRSVRRFSLRDGRVPIGRFPRVAIRQTIG